MPQVGVELGPLRFGAALDAEAGGTDKTAGNDKRAALAFSALKKRRRFPSIDFPPEQASPATEW